MTSMYLCKTLLTFILKRIVDKHLHFSVGKIGRSDDTLLVNMFFLQTMITIILGVMRTWFRNKQCNVHSVRALLYSKTCWWETKHTWFMERQIFDFPRPSIYNITFEWFLELVSKKKLTLRYIYITNAKFNYIII